MQQIAMPQPSLDIIKTATDSLLLPLRRPVLFVPFLFTTAMLSVLGVVVVYGTLTNWSETGRINTQQIIALAGSVALIIFTSILAGETIIVLAARAELGKDVDLNEALAHALSRFPVTLATTAVITAGIVVGFILLIIPGVVLMLRWFLAPNVALLSRRGVRDAIVQSWQMTGAHFGPLASLMLVVTLGTGILSVPLGFIPVAGQLAAGWLGFAWGAIALTLAHVRLGAPVDLG